MTELTSGPLPVTRGAAGVSSCSFSLILTWTHVPHQLIQEAQRARELPGSRAWGEPQDGKEYPHLLPPSVSLLPVYPHDSGSHKCVEHLFGEAVLEPSLRASTLF